MGDMKNKMIQSEKDVKIFPFEFIKDDSPLEQFRNFKKNKPTKKKGKKKKPEDFREFYY